MSGGIMARLWATGASLAAPMLRLWLRRRLAHRKERTGRLAERRGIDPTPRPAGRLIWLHAASVGETVSVLPLVASLGRQDADLNFLITTGTVTSAALLQERLPGLDLGFRARHRFVPLDVPAWVQRFLEHWRPDAAAFVESELWPNLIAGAAKRGIPLALVNARLSARSYRRWRMLAPGLAQRMLRTFSLVAARSVEDAERLAILGTRRVEVPGDLKRAAPPLPVDEAERLRLSALLESRPRWLAASTHLGEEEIAAAVHRRLRQEFPGLLTIIAPRHPERGGEIASQLADLKPKRRALGEDPPAGGIWIADTLGELGLFYRLAPVAFMGKSLTARGGQNPFEAARLGAAIATGPHTGNFLVAVARLEAAEALTRIGDGDALAAWVGAMLRDPAKATSAGEAAAAASKADAGLPDRLATLLLELMDRSKDC
ncbi:MAG: 3-deoxy-D-manno-octulosonic acid transferase [Acetobacteraceae bacterium]